MAHDPTRKVTCMKNTAWLLMLIFSIGSCDGGAPSEAEPKNDPSTWWDDENCYGHSTCPDYPEIEYVYCCYGTSCAYTFENGRLAFGRESLLSDCAGTKCMGGINYSCLAFDKKSCEARPGCVWGFPDETP